jgi:S-formylglutathione hydrolase FrmB
MAVLDVRFYSEALQVSTAMTVILPQRPRTQIGLGSPGGPASAPSGPAGDPPVLYLLHGLGDDESVWLRYTTIERCATQRGLAVVMPRGGRSFYQDEVHGAPYWAFLSQELPEIVHGFFHVSTRREDTFVAGLSMGGYGAMRWALTEPGRFAAAASLSGALDLAARAGAAPSPAPGGEGVPAAGDPDAAFLAFAPDVRDRVFGGRFEPGGDNDLIALLARADGPSLPALWVSCGRRDALLAHSQRFVEAARAAGADPHAEYPDGTHEWGLWEAQIHRVVDWLPLR